jgi:hypothetical protein
MAAPDNRIRFPAAKIDFATDVGIASQDHDSYPPAQGQARYDHMRMAVIGLLSQQSSFDEPSQYRDGTPWFDLNDNTLKISLNSEWIPISDAISIEQDISGLNTKTLTEFITEFDEPLSSLAAEIVFSGSATATASSITIPTSLRSGLYSDSRAFVWVNGLLKDPRNTTIQTGTSITLSGFTLSASDTFTVSIRRVPSSTFYTQSVSVP